MLIKMKLSHTTIYRSSLLIISGFIIALPALAVELQNPIGSDNLEDLIKKLANAMISLAIPIAVIIIIYAGILYLTSGGEPKQVGKAKDALKYSVMGLAVVLIGYGFVALIKSILDLSK